MLPSKVNPSNIHSVCQKMNSLRAKIPQGRVKFKVGDLVRITKEKVKFSKGMNKIFNRNISSCQGYPAHASTCLRTLRLVGSSY